MSRELESEIRDRLRGAVLPLAPERLLERARSVTTQPVARVAGGSPDRRWRLFAPLAAVLVIAAVAVLGLGGRLPNGLNPGSQGPSSATFTVVSRIGEWCGPIGCEFQIELTGPGGPWEGELEGFTLGDSSPISPALPTVLGSGSYELKASIHVISDAIEPGQLEGRDLGTTATCSAKFQVQPGIQMVAATIGFWLDRCSVGALAMADQPSLATFALATAINGECGEFGCDYRVVLTGPGGAWPMVVSSQKPASELAPGPAMPPYLPPGAYRLEASAHRMSEEPEPGVGHQHELGVAGSCSTEFVITPEVERIDATATFEGVGCTVGTTTTDRPESAAELRVTAFLGQFCGSIGGCAEAIELAGDNDAWRADLESTAESADMIVGEGLPESLRPGNYSARAWLLFMSDAILNGVRESFGSESCSVDFKVEPGDHRVTLDIAFTAGGCTINANVERTVTAPTPDLAAPSPSTGPESTDGGASPGSRERWYGPAYPAEPPPGGNVPIERARLSGDGRTLKVEFSGGGCSHDYVPWVGLSGSELLVSIVAVPRSGPPLPSGFACILVAYPYKYHLALSEPYLGTTVRLGDDSVLIID